jgi:hypothetical protein
LEEEIMARVSAGFGPARSRLVVSAAMVAILSAAGCSSSGPAATCTLRLSGNVNAGATAPTDCAVTIDPSDASPGSSVLLVHANSPQITDLRVSIDMGTAAVGTLASEGVTAWSASALAGGASSECALSAGIGAVPAGSFSLDVTHLGVAGAAGASEVHGSLSLLLYVHAPPKTDCGPGDVEQVDLSF